MADASDLSALAERIQAFLDAATQVVRGYAAAVRAYVTDGSMPVQLDREHHRKISETAHGCPAFEQLGRFAFAMRNDIVHGDVRPSRSELAALADFLGTALRQTVVAALRLGDQSCLIRAVTEDDVRRANRLLVPHF